MVLSLTLSLIFWGDRVVSVGHDHVSWPMVPTLRFGTNKVVCEMILLWT